MGMNKLKQPVNQPIGPNKTEHHQLMIIILYQSCRRGQTATPFKSWTKI